MNVTVDEMIRASVSEDRIVRTAAAVLAADLHDACDGHASDGAEAEYWGTDGEGGEWRIHIVRESTRRGWW